MEGKENQTPVIRIIIDVALDSFQGDVNTVFAPLLFDQKTMMMAMQMANIHCVFTLLPANKFILVTFCSHVHCFSSLIQQCYYPILQMRKQKPGEVKNLTQVTHQVSS